MKGNIKKDKLLRLIEAEQNLSSVQKAFIQGVVVMARATEQTKEKLPTLESTG